MRERTPLEEWRHRKLLRDEPFFRVGDIVTHANGYGANIGIVTRVSKLHSWHAVYRYQVQWGANPHFRGHYARRGRLSENDGCSMMLVTVENLPLLQREAARRFCEIHPEQAAVLASLLRLESEDHLARAPLD